MPYFFLGPCIDHGDTRTDIEASQRRYFPPWDYQVTGGMLPYTRKVTHGITLSSHQLFFKDAMAALQASTEPSGCTSDTRRSNNCNSTSKQ
jgi:hypothetical protein